MVGRARDRARNVSESGLQSSGSGVTQRSRLLGVVTVAGASIGAGMLAMPLVSAGMWFPLTLVSLVVVWWVSYCSAMLVVNIGIDFEPGASFATYVRAILGPRWSAATDLSVGALLYTLMYAYISGGSSVLAGAMGWPDPWGQRLAAIVLCSAVAWFAWRGGVTVARLCLLLLLIMAVAFLVSVSDLLATVDVPALLLHEWHFSAFVAIALPVFLTSFGFSAVVPSLVVVYGPDRPRLRYSVLAGSLLALAAYVLWCAAVFGQLDRPWFMGASERGDVSGLVQALGDSGTRSTLISTFSFFAVLSSFFALALSLTDFLWDLIGRTRVRRWHAVALALLPPLVLSSTFPRGFVPAIGFAGLVMVFGFMWVPAIMTLKRTGRMNAVPLMVLVGGAVVAVCHVLAMMDLLPRY